MGRPKKSSVTPSGSERCVELTREVLAWLYAHPGAATNTGRGRRFYADAFRHRILELRETYAELELETFARAVQLPLGTIDGWLRKKHSPPPSESPSREGPVSETTSLYLQTIITAWRDWHGAFGAFVQHVKHNLRIPYFGASFIARVLFEHNERIPRRRTGRSPDEEATRNSFEVYFPNAQWVGDGMQVPVVLNGDCFHFNLELHVDSFSGAIVGASIRDEEDSRAVVEAFEDGVKTTGTPPLMLLLDNRSCNHTDEVAQALVSPEDGITGPVADAVKANGGTGLMHATLGRAQNKAHVEGTFGLFSQQAPKLEICAHSPRELAREFLRLQVQTFARDLNYKPRRDRNWQSRCDIHRGATPTQEEIEAARQALEACRLKIERARANDRERADPLILRFLDEAFERLQIEDPKHHIRHAIARYGRDIALEAVAIFEGKLNVGTLPDGAKHARYILGIAKNIDHVHEADAITLALIRNRTTLKDAALAPLANMRDNILASSAEPNAMLRSIIDLALNADRGIDQFFWIDTAAEILRAQPDRDALFRRLAGRIHATFALTPSERSTIERRLARLVWPIS